MDTPKSERATFSIGEAATLLGIGRSLAYELARRGELPGARRLGHRLVVSRKVLEAFLECKTNDGLQNDGLQ